MKREDIVPVFVQLGKVLEQISMKKEWPGFEIGLTKEEYNQFIGLLAKEHFYNPWFTVDNCYKALGGIATFLDADTLNEFTNRYPVPSKSKTIAIVMAGNIPFVGFHDLLCVLLSGNKALCKLSSSDARIPTQIISWLINWQPELKSQLTISLGPIKNFDAVIATGSNNSISHFEAYFGKYPHLFRKSRTSIAVLDGTETKEGLIALGDDCFSFFGLGCRNVSKLFLPIGYDLNQLFEAFVYHGDIVNHHKYANNYDYNRTVFMMNKIPFLDNNAFILKEDEGLHAPLSVIYYAFYDSKDEIMTFLDSNRDAIQAIVGHDYIPFGQAQQPAIDDYADGVDTMQWLCNLD